MNVLYAVAAGIVMLCVCAARAEGERLLELEQGYAKPAIARAGRPTEVVARVANSGPAMRQVRVELVLPDGVKVVEDKARDVASWARGETKSFAWTVSAERATEGFARIKAWQGEACCLDATFPAAWTAPVEVKPAAYVPEPRLATGEHLVGAMMVPLWKEGTRGEYGWEQILPYPEREPALGWYDEGNPEVTDWEIKWCLEHGISFFVYCWFRERENLGKPVEVALEHWLTEGLFHARYGDAFKFAIMWENQNHIACGVESEQDLMENLLPYWINNYFLRTNYLKVDGKPVLYVFFVEKLIGDLGGVENVRGAVEKMREACRKAGFEGLIVLGAHHMDAQHPALGRIAECGFDYVFSYHWPTLTSKMPKEIDLQEIMRAQEACWREQEDSVDIPSVVTVSMGWDSEPWGSNVSKVQWQLPPDRYEELLRRAKAVLAERPSGSLQSRMVLLDNWNEFGEGHYIMPHRQYGFGYLDAVRNVFTGASKSHTDLVPEDVGLGPYDSLLQAHLKER